MEKPWRMSLQTAIFVRVVLISSLINITGMLFILYVVYSFLINSVITARQDLLHQALTNIGTVKNVVISTSDSAMEQLVRMIEEDDMLHVENISEGFEHLTETMGRLGFQISLDVVMKHGAAYSSEPAYRDDLTKFIASYWFMSLESGSRSEAWGIRTIAPDQMDIVLLSYSRAIQTGDGKTVGVLLVNVEHATLYNTYAKLLGGENRIHIIDQDGIAISFSNLRMIGHALYDMDNFERNVAPKNSAVIRRNMGKTILFSNYTDSASGWTIIEEMALSSLLKPYHGIIFTIVGVMSTALLISLLGSLQMSKSTTRRLGQLADQMAAFQKENHLTRLFEITQRDYREVYALGAGFNAMLENIRTLIDAVRKEDEEKHILEFQFLQSQINPHFLHNTLLTMKGLLALYRVEEAGEMLDAFVHLIRVPMDVQKPAIPLSDELDSVRGYVRIMEYRYCDSFHLNIAVEDGLERFPVLQLLLQPIVENAIFHGFGEKKENMYIHITAESTQTGVLIRVTDNGKGITPEHLENLWHDSSKEHGFNRVGMKNIRDRLRHVYGNLSSIKVKSEQFHGTEVSIFIPANVDRVI